MASDHSEFDDDGKPRRTGTMWSCVAHIVTALIGSGVLSLAWGVAQLGWVGGPVAMISMALTTYAAVSLLSDCYRSPHPVTGARNPTYSAAVNVNMGPKAALFCAVLQYAYMYGISVVYVLATATSLRTIGRSNCYHRKGHESPCRYGSNNIYMLVFGVIQIFLSQTPDFHSMKWISVVAAVMSICYSSAGVVLGLLTVTANGRVKGGLKGVDVGSGSMKTWLVFQGLGDIVFAYPFTSVLLEIQDTLRSPPPENQTIKRASALSISITTFFYLCCACLGYAAFGDVTPGNLLTGFGFYEPFWLVDFANACVVIHLVGGYQMFSQPIFAAAEGWWCRRFQENRIVGKWEDTVRAPFIKGFHISPFKLCFRTAYVFSTVAISIVFPYFNQVLGLLGALGFWPLTIYFPVELYIRQNRCSIRRWGRKWVLLQGFSFCCFILSLVTLLGSVQGIIAARLG